MGVRPTMDTVLLFEMLTIESEWVKREVLFQKKKKYKWWTQLLNSSQKNWGGEREGRIYIYLDMARVVTPIDPTRNPPSPPADPVRKRSARCSSNNVDLDEPFQLILLDTKFSKTPAGWYGKDKDGMSVSSTRRPCPLDCVWFNQMPRRFCRLIDRVL